MAGFGDGATLVHLGECFKGGFGGWGWNGQRQYWVVTPFGLHSGLRQSGDAFGVAFFVGLKPHA